MAAEGYPEYDAHGQTRRPLTGHPLFPGVIAVWFGALFSLSSLAISGELLERVVLASQVDLLVPAATPPLGTTFRLMLALALGVVGAGLGWLLARLLSGSPGESGRYDDEPETELWSGADRAWNHADMPARRPIQAHEELGAVSLGIAAPSTSGSGGTETASPAPAASAAGAGIQPMTVAIAPTPAPAYYPGSGEDEHTGHAMPATPAAETPATPPDEPAPGLHGHTPENAPGNPGQHLDVPSPDATQAEPATAAERIARAPLEALSPVELLARLSVAMERRRLHTERHPRPPRVQAPAQGDPGDMQSGEAPLRSAIASLRGLR